MNGMNGKAAKFLVVGCGILLAVAAYMYLNRGYGQISELGYQYATALYSACNQSDDEKLEKLSEMIAASQAQREIDDRETRWLQGIIERGRRGDWQAGAREARRLLADQVQGV